MAEPEAPQREGPSKPIWLRYPDASSEVRFGQGVYFHPVVKIENLGDAEEEKRNFQDFVEMAQSVTNCFAGDDHFVNLDQAFLQEVWDASAGEPEDIRVDWAINELCDILEKTPTAGLGEGVELDREIWRSAKHVLMTELMETGVTKGLTFSVEPPLPEGLSIASSTGIISGNPVKSCESQEHKVTVKSEIGFVECTLSLKVCDATAPQSICYKKVDKAYLCGQPVVISPKVEGIVTAWSIRPALPKNLRIDTTTGTICGIPKEVIPETTWTVIAKNDLGSCTTKISFEVAEAPPSNLKYHADGSTSFASDRTGFCGRQAVQTFPVNRWMCLRPTVDGGVHKYEAKPEFPAGITMNAETGVISGTPTAEVPTTAYTVTGSNDGGSVKCVISFAIKNLPTIGISYPTFDDVYCVGEVIMCEPQVQGGATTWVVDPPFPKGINLDPGNGTISGTCPEVLDEASYTVTASNEVGGTSTILTFMVIAMPPEGLSYLEMVDEYFVGEAVSVRPELLCGEGNVDFFVKPDLPAGLELHKDTGVISGTPSAETELAEYTVRAENPMGLVFCALEFRVTKKPDPRAAPARQQSMATGALMRAMTRKATQQALGPSSSSSGGAGGGSAGVSALEGVAEGEEEDEDEAAVEEKQAQAMIDFAHKLQNVEDVKDLPAEPNKAINAWEWMLWMTHRAWLEDPALTTVSFKGLEVPLPDVEPRVFPKLMQALSATKTITSLDLASCNLRAPHGQLLTQAMKKNGSLLVLNLDGNWLESGDVEAIAEALAESDKSKLTTWMCSGQQGLAGFGKPTEELLAKMLEKNLKITKLSIPLEDPHWKSVIERSLKRNTDSMKRSVKMKAGAGSEKVLERNLNSITIVKVPSSSAADLFKSGDEKLSTARLFTCEKKRLPMKDQLQLFAKNRGQPLKYSEVAPLVRSLRKILLDGVVGLQIIAVDSTNKKTEGVLKAWSEKNDRWSVDVESEGQLIRYSSPKDPVLEVSLEVAEWLAPPAAATSATE
eukprot:CAMPEP_0206438026 /NCGR_PEP_ID=MMETSP0324_2-20121206/11376_1 /ASSEMBLY_ACC=CAM_ASM_000836 /TAXON_ID=2866 /ORGANISM="Crypthecodinium cohnii, Strain Seligo" /LENGTH=1006 /DNA_ID=CAMNT_0053905389 /DNA_START=57 /DNA_END=3077 /DNA_ORIENTATION=+